MSRRRNAHGLPGVGTRAHRIRILERDNWTCGICHQPIDPELSVFESDWVGTIDHIRPRYFSGGHEDDNLQAAHLICNQKKGTRLTWAARIKPPKAAQL